jgi:hypothetical protein
MRSVTSVMLVALMVGACGGAAPVAEMSRAERAILVAQEVGAEDQPASTVYLLLAREAYANARDRLAAGDREGARRLLLRAEADAELALTVARESSVRDAAERTMEEASQLGDELR